MWLMTDFGFFSVVEKPGDEKDGMLTVRARLRGDLEELRDRYLPEMEAIREGEGTDYPYRVRVPKDAWGQALSRIGRDVDYSNFKKSVAAKQGPDRASVYGAVWSALADLHGMEPGGGRDPGDAPAKDGTAYGGVLIDTSGRVLLREPKGHFDGYVWTFPKGKPMPGETEADAALREVREESGYRCEILARLPGMYRGGMGQNVFFLMRPEGAPGDLDGETASTRWVEPAEAEVLIHKTTNTVGRKRDLNVLADALALGEQSGVLRK